MWERGRLFLSRTTSSFFLASVDQLYSQSFNIVINSVLLLVTASPTAWPYLLKLFVETWWSCMKIHRIYSNEHNWTQIEGRKASTVTTIAAISSKQWEEWKSVLSINAIVRSNERRVFAKSRLRYLPAACVWDVSHHVLLGTLLGLDR